MKRQKEDVPCVRCGDTFERERRNGYFCGPCISAMDDKAELERVKERRERSGEILERHGLIDWIPRIDDERLKEIGLATGDGKAALRDAADPIEGALSEAGPDEGRSTFFKDLAEQLDILCAKVPEHPWWKQNKTWHYALHDAPKAAVFFSRVRAHQEEGPKCGDKKGTPAGYMRHYRAGEMACPACSAAKAVQSRQDRVA